MTLGKRIRERRTALGLTQQELAEILGVTPQHISYIEQDKRVPSLSSLTKIAEELGVTVEFLIAGKEGKDAVMGVIPAIKADKRLDVKTKRILVALVEAFYEASHSK